MSGEPLDDALGRLDPGDRALIELSLQRGIPDAELAQLLGSDGSAIEKRRRALIESLAVDTGRPAREVDRALRDLPVGEGSVAEEDAAASLHGGESRTERSAEKRAGFLRRNSLSIFFLVIFLAALAGQSYAGWKEYNEAQLDHEESQIAYGRYLASSQFGQAVAENWQSEYLQFVLYFMATIWLVQRGSPSRRSGPNEGSSRTRSSRSGRTRGPIRRGSPSEPAAWPGASTRIRC